MPSRQCLSCGRLTRGASYCRACAAKRNRARLRAAPWLRLYRLPEWNRVKWAVHRRDGFRCMHVGHRGRCRVTTETGRIEAHHVVKVRILYMRARGDWDKFLRAALDPSNIVSLCFLHHLEADKPGRQASSALSARPKAQRTKTAAKRGHLRRVK